MKLPRRQFMRLAAGVVALPSVSRVARGDAYPAKPVRLMNGFAAGGTADIFARLMGQWLSERLGQQFLTENRTGAASNIATEAVIRAPADGYTLLLATPANAMNATLYEKLNYDFIRDTAPVAGIMVVANVMEVHPSLPVKTRSGVHRLCQSQPWQDQHGIGRRRNHTPRLRRIVQVYDRDQFDPRAVSWRRARTE